MSRYGILPEFVSEVNSFDTFFKALPFVKALYFVGHFHRTFILSFLTSCSKSMTAILG